MSSNSILVLPGSNLGPSKIRSGRGSKARIRYALVTLPRFVVVDVWDQYPAHPGVQHLVDEYIGQIDNLAQDFVHLVAECLSLPPDTFDNFKGQMSRLKFVKYPKSAPGSQGVGPHKDSAGLFTFLSQDSTGGLEVLNKNGEWIGVPPVEGSLVVNIQQGFEAITGGVCTATTHRVIVRIRHLLEQLKMGWLI